MKINTMFGLRVLGSRWQARRIAPAASECNVDSVGNVARVDCTATYAFFEAGSLPAYCR